MASSVLRLVSEHANYSHLVFVPPRDVANVPQKYSEKTELGVWVNKQRMEKKAFDEGKKSSMTRKKIAKLESAGFKWYFACFFVRIVIVAVSHFYDSLTGRNLKEWAHGRGATRSCSSTSTITVTRMSLPSLKRTVHLVVGYQLNGTCIRNIANKASSTT
jgi:hypothetical protein